MKKILDEDFTDKHSEQFDDDDDVVEELSALGESDDILGVDYLDDPNESEDAAELERRKTAYSTLKKDDKIFNNSFNMGTAVDEHSDTRGRNEIRIDPGSSEYNFYDKDKHSDFIDEAITNFDITSFVQSCSRIQEILKQPDDGSKKKFTKIEINEMFDLVKNGVSTGSQSSVFVNAIHILDSISALTSLEYKKLFDMLKYENKELLLLELDKKYQFLNRAPKDFKMYE